MDYVQILKTKRNYIVPSFQIMWSISKHTLRLEAVIDVQKHDEGDLSLPPTEFGHCKDWCLTHGDGVYGFSACWELRRVKDSLHLIGKVTANLEPYAVERG